MNSSPSSKELVAELRHIESSLSIGGHVLAPIDQIREQLSAKEDECRQKDAALGEKDEALREKDEALWEKEVALREKDEALNEKDNALMEKVEALRENEAALREKDEVLREKEALLREKDETIRGNDVMIKGKDEALQRLDMTIREQEQALKEKDVALREKDITIKEQQDAIQVQQASNPTASQKQQDSIRAQQAEIERLRKQLAVFKQVKHSVRDWKKLRDCQKVIKHSPEGGWYQAVAVNSVGPIAVTDGVNECVHLLAGNGRLVTSIGEGMLGGSLFGVSFDLKGNVWVADWDHNAVVKLSQEGKPLQIVSHAHSRCHPAHVSVSPEGLIYMCDRVNHHVTVCDEEGSFLFTFGSKGSGPGCFESPGDIAFGSDGLVYVVDGRNKVRVWSKAGTFKREFTTKYNPYYIAATSDSRLLITSFSSHTVMVYTLEGELIHQFGGKGLKHPYGICVNDNGLVYTVDVYNKYVQVF